MERNRCCHLEQSYLSSVSPGSCSVPPLSCSFSFPPSLYCHNTTTNQTVSEGSFFLTNNRYTVNGSIANYNIILHFDLSLSPEPRSFVWENKYMSFCDGWRHRDTQSYLQYFYHLSHHVISLCNSIGLPCLHVSQWSQQQLGFDINTHHWHSSS